MFFIDVVTEFLETPLRCLSYLELRAKAGNDVLLSHEITALAFHLKQNLWLGEYDAILLEDDISTSVDIAMAVRREGIAGEKTPPGILTQLRGTTVGAFWKRSRSDRKPERSALGWSFSVLAARAPTT